MPQGEKNIQLLLNIQILTFYKKTRLCLNTWFMKMEFIIIYRVEENGDN